MKQLRTIILDWGAALLDQVRGNALALYVVPSRLIYQVLFHRIEQRFLIVALSLFATICGIAGPLFQKAFVDNLLGYPSELSVLDGQPPWSYLLIAFSLIALYQLSSVVSSFLGNREAMIMQKVLSEQLYAKMLSMRTDQLQSRPTGEIVSLFATDVPGATILLEQSLPMGFSILFPLFLSPIFLSVAYGIPLYVTTLVILGITVVNGLLARRQSRFFYFFKQLAAERVGLINEWIQNIRTLRVLSWVEKFEEKITSKREQETTNRVKMVTNGQLMNSLSSSVTFAVNMVGVWALLELTPGPHSPGQILALFWILAIFLTRSFRQMPWFFTFILDGMSSVNRLQDFMDEPDDRNDHVGALSHPTNMSSGLSIRNLQLSAQDKPLLKDISLEVAPGEFVAVVGEVGSGKTLLLLSLIGETGFTADAYSVGSQSALALDKNELKSLFALVTQEGFVISASIRENVAFDYGTDHSLDQRIHSALIKSQLNLTAEHFMEGLETEIGERGVNLSGGQRQRLTLARADFFDRSILLLDDCLSALDVNTEKKLIEDLIDGKWRNHTRLLVTHRLTILPKVNRVVFMQEGRILDQGSYVDLMNRNAAFAEFSRSLRSAEVSAP